MAASTFVSVSMETKTSTVQVFLKVIILKLWGLEISFKQIWNLPQKHVV